VSWGVSAAVHALETALETALPAEAEAVTNPPSVIEEAPSASIEEAPSASPASPVPPEPLDVLLPRRRPTVPPPAAPGDAAARDTAPGHDGTSPAEAGAAQPARPPRRAPDLALLDQVLRGLQRMA
jgi:hypothetical protein